MNAAIKNSQVITIVDYGMGNLLSVKKKLDRLNYGTKISSSPADILASDKIILPGVGHFQKAMKNLQILGLYNALNEAVLQKKIPVFGICLGMQLMAKHSQEGDAEGLGWFDAEVVKFNIKDTLKYKIPHTGWNQAMIKKQSKLMNGIPDNSEFYFVHAYHIKLNNNADALHETDYEYPFVSAVEKENIIGVQYHPEKSHEDGELLLKNFINNY
jgi:imidazole glycerol-phosphate synthase subunit HisH